MGVGNISKLQSCSVTNKHKVFAGIGIVEDNLLIKKWNPNIVCNGVNKTCQTTQISMISTILYAEHPVPESWEIHRSGQTLNVFIHTNPTVYKKQTIFTMYLINSYYVKISKHCNTIF